MTDLAAWLAAGGIARRPEAPLTIRGGDPVLAARHRIGEAAAVALALGGGVAAELHAAAHGGDPPPVTVDTGHAAATLLGFLLQSVPGGSDLDVLRRPAATTRIVRCRDGRFLHLHGGFPHLHEGTLALLGCRDDREAIDAAAARWDAFALEEALAERRLCGAAVRSSEEWQAHPQGLALAGAPVVRLTRLGDAPAEALPGGEAPLDGVRVLDLTRVLAGPTCGRTLASYGADVLRIASPRLPSIEPFVIDTGHGKRSTHVDLEDARGRATLGRLLAEADVLVDGYRPGSLARRGLGDEALARARPGIVVVSISCYGAWGPWAARGGWEQLAQSTTGIAGVEGGEGPPRLLPAAATDDTTGDLAAYGAMEALRRRSREGGRWRVDVSLSRTAMWIQARGSDLDPGSARGLPDVAALQIESETPRGRLTHLAPGVRIDGVPVAWRRPTVPLGHDAPEWLPRHAG